MNEWMDGWIDGVLCKKMEGGIVSGGEGSAEFTEGGGGDRIMMG